MTDLGQLLTGFAPQRVMPRKQADALSSTAKATTQVAESTVADGPFNEIMNLLAPMDPLMRAVATSAIEDGLHVPRGTIPSPEEHTLRQLQLQEQTYARHKSLLVEKVKDVQASIADMPEQMKSNLGIDEDTLKTDPQRFITFARKALQSDLSMGDLMRVDMLETPMQRQKAAQEKQHADLEAAVQPEEMLVRDLQAKRALNVGTSKTPALLAEADFPGLAKTALKSRGEQMDQDLFPPGWQFWTGANANSFQGADRELESQVRAAGPLLGKYVARGFLDVLKGPLGQAMNELPKVQAETPEGGKQTRVGVVGSKKGFMAATVALRIAALSDTPIEDVLKAAGVDANAIDLDSYAATKKAIEAEP